MTASFQVRKPRWATVSITRDGSVMEGLVRMDAETFALITTLKHEEATLFSLGQARRILKLLRKHHPGIKRITLHAKG